jgi:hypothetical protein
VRTGALAALSVAGAAAVLVLALGPLQSHRRPWDAAVFHDGLRGRILQQPGASLAIVSMTGQGSGTQNVLVRADLLVGADGVHATTFQLEYLPSGTLCTGTVTDVHATGFSGVCRLGHAHRHVTASWRPAPGGSVTGSLDVRL